MPRSLCAAFQETVVALGDRTAIEAADGTPKISWSEYGARVRRIAAGLAELGVRRGDVVGLMLTNRPEFHLVDAAAMHLGAAGFSVYNTNTAAQIGYLFANAAPTVVVTESQFLPRVLEATEISPAGTVVVVDGPADGAVTLDEVIAGGREDFDFEAAWRAVDESDVLTIIYTSGTTGDPKGVELTHANLLYQLDAVRGVVGGFADGRVLSYLPDAHLINRWVCQYAPMVYGTTVTDLDNPKTLVDALGAVRPTFFVAVPMLWYKIKGRVEGRLAAGTGLQGALARWAVGVGRRRAAAIVAGRPVPAIDRLLWTVADRVVLSRLRAALGMDVLVSAVSGAAPIDVAALEFMLAIGVPVMEAWGMSETSAVTTVNPPDRPRYDTVGRAIPGTEVALDADGEVLVRGGGVMRGYRGDPGRTAETLDGKGWIHTGDIGTLDADGYLKIIDRKKEMIINSGGKNMSPSNIEGALKAASSLVGSVVAIGDNRPFVSALITLDPEAVAAFAAERGITDTDPASLAAHPDVQAALTDAVAAANERLSRVEHVRNWTVLGSYWQPGGDELTPTMKIKRASVSTKYTDEIEALYR